jgi:hypothetical protein
MKSHATAADSSRIVPKQSLTSFAVILGSVIFFILAMSPSLRAQGLRWARRAGGTSTGDAATGTAVDAVGNVYVTGIFQGSATFGLGEANQTTLTTAGGEDMFVARYDASGALQWVRRAGGTGVDRGSSIALDSVGNIYVAGMFQGSATFGLGETNQTTLLSAGGDDIFIAQYDASGALQWVKRAGGTGSDQGTSVAVDDSGNSYLAGFFNAAAIFAQGQANQTTLTAAGNSDIFIARYDFNGTLLWVMRAGGTGLDQSVGIAVDSAGNSYVTGLFNNSATFGQGQANQTTITSSGDRDMFVAQYDTNGSLQWVKRSGGTGADRGFNIVVDDSGNSYVTGLFNGSAIFGPGEPNQTSLTSAGVGDIFFAKHDFTGALVWVKRAGGTGDDGGLGIAVDGFGNIYATGFFSGSATFGQGQATQTTLVSAGRRDIFITKYNSNGLLQWVKGAGASATSTDQGLGIALDEMGAIYVSGYFGDGVTAGVATFGQGEPNQTTLTSAGGADVFLAQFAGNNTVDSTGPALTIASHTNNQSTTSSPITLSGSASDAASGGNGISIVTVNGAAATGGTANGSGTAAWSQSVTLSPGANLITVVAKDASPNQNVTSLQITLHFSPTLTISATDDTATELGPTTGMFTVSRSGGTASALTVNYTIGGTATPGSDYFALAGSTVILTGQSSAQIVVTPIDDGVVGENDETVTVTLTPDAAYTVGGQNSAGVTIVDNNPATVTISATDDTATELGPTTGMFTVSRSGSTVSALAVNYTVSGTATPGSDYQPLSGSVLIAAGQSSTQIVVTPVYDGIAGEGDETVIVVLAAGGGYVVGGQSSTTVTIIDNNLPTVTVSATDDTATEQGSTTGIFTVSRSGGTLSALTVNYTVSGTATPGSDYQPLSGSVLIAAGQSSAQIVVTAIDDGIVAEGDETVIVALAADTAYTVGVQSSATVTLADDDTAPGSLLWAKRAGGTNPGDAATATAADGAGNVYVAGIFQGSAIFGLGESNQTTLTSAGGDDMFVARYDSSGALQWVKRAGGTGMDRGLGVAVDASGYVFVTGLFQGLATFGSGETHEKILSSSGSDDVFLAQFDGTGALQWVKRAGGTASDQGVAVAVDDSGSAYLTGFFNGSATFAQGEANQTTLISAGSADIFVAQYDFTGALRWVRRAGGTGSDQSVGIGMDGAGNSYVTGFFNGTATFGQGQGNQTTLASAGDRDMFVAQYDANGFLQWVKRSGGTGADRGFNIAVDGSGNSYVTGLFNGSATFGQGQANQTTLTSAGLGDIFIAKHDSTGTLQWVRRAGGTSDDGGLSIAVDGSGNTYLTGFFNGINHHGTATFGLGEPNQTTLTSAGDRDVFVVKYDPSGLLQWAKRAGAGGASTDQGMSIALDGLGAIYVSGYFGDHATAGVATFGLGEPNQTTLTSAGSADVFVAKYAD